MQKKKKKAVQDKLWENGDDTETSKKNAVFIDRDEM